MTNISEILFILVPVAILQFALAVTAIVHVVKHPKCKILNKPVWIIMSVCLGFIGPVLYFVLGRGEE